MAKSSSRQPVAANNGVDVKSKTKQAWLIASGFLLFALIGDSVIDITLHVLDILIEFLELGLEDALELLFDLEGHTAQMYTAWIGFTAFILLFMYLYHRITHTVRTKFRSWSYFRLWLGAWMREHWLLLAVCCSIYITSAFLI